MQGVNMGVMSMLGKWMRWLKSDPMKVEHTQPARNPRGCDIDLDDRAKLELLLKKAKEYKIKEKRTKGVKYDL